MTLDQSRRVETSGSTGGRARSRVVLYALSNASRDDDPYVQRALEALRPHAGRLVLLAGSRAAELPDALHVLVDETFEFEGEFRRAHYEQAWDSVAADDPSLDELLLTGDGWYGPGATGIVSAVEGMSESDADLWELFETVDDALRDFSEQGFPARERPLIWARLRGPLLRSDCWRISSDDRALAARVAGAGFSTAAGYTSADFGSANPAVFAVERLVRAGAPVLPREAFTLYPPYLHQHAVIGREAMAAASARGFVAEEILQNLVRTVAPKVLNTNLGMLDILVPASLAPAVWGARLAAVVHVADEPSFASVLTHLDHLPAGADLFVTCSDGLTAVRLRQTVDERAHTFAHVDVRVTPANRGRDMSDLFIACRDVILSGRYDVMVKVHARPMRRKTGVVRSYFRSYQLGNLLGSRTHVARILDRFHAEPGLGLVFPPMMHIGYQTMGKAWAGYRTAAARLADRMGIRVPLDSLSPLAPYGRMWFARTEALRALAEQDWTYRDYGRPGRKTYGDLARLQERMVVASAAEHGFHSRTVLAPRHAAISHTALEFKVDELFSTTTGYPVDQITLLQRAGRTGYGGIVGLSRMYLRLNHPRFARLAMPAIDGLDRAYRTVRGLFGTDPRFARPQRDFGEDER